VRPFVGRRQEQIYEMVAKMEPRQPEKRILAGQARGYSSREQFC